MIFIVGAAFILISIVLLIKFLKNSGKPKVDAKVLGLLKEAAPGSFIEVPHALVEYHYNNQKYNGKVMLRSKPQNGDTIKLAVDAKVPAKAAEYYPKIEKLSIIITAVMGVALMVVAVVVQSML